MAYDNPYAYGDVTPPDETYYDEPVSMGDVPGVESGLDLVANFVTSSPELFGPSVGGVAWGGTSLSTNTGGLANSDSMSLAQHEKSSGSWIDKFIKGIKDNPASAKIISDMLGGLYTASNQKKQLALENRKIGVQEGHLQLNRDQERRRATSMQGVTVHGVGLINSKPTQPKFNQNIYPQFTARGQK